MTVTHFVDTNIVVYAYGPDPKVGKAGQLLADATISVQVLNEFAHVAMRKMRCTSRELDQRISSIRGQVLTVMPVDEPTHDLARTIAFRYKLAFYDSCLLASAMLADCETFYSEDMQDGLVIDGMLTIRNPFR